LSDTSAIWRNRIIGYSEEAPDQLLASPSNWRIHPKNQQDALSGVLTEIGLVQNIICNQTTGHVVDGHLRITLALRSEQPTVPVTWVDLTEEEEHLILASLDPIAAMAAADKVQLESLLRDVQTGEAGVQAMLSDLAEREGIVPGLEPVEDAEPQIDKAEELRVKWGVEMGDLWQLGDHRVICGDCTDAEVVARVMDGEKAYYGMHDPPYGIEVVGLSSTDSEGKSYGTGRIGFDGVVKANTYHPVIGDNKSFDPRHLLELSEFCILWGANYYADKLPPMKGWIVWDKKGRDDWRDTFSDCELAWSNIKTVTRIFRHTWMGMVQDGRKEARVHPTQKPSIMFEKIMLDLFTEDGVVIDCYLGSGTTLIACERLNRKCRGIEISPAYVAVTIQRWVDATGGEPVRVDEMAEKSV